MCDEMARKAREKSSTGIYHILLRANNKLFLNDGDREYFISLVGQYFRDGVSIYGYRIDTEKVHIVLKENTKTISEAMKAFCTSYARYFNRVHGTDGKLFDGRFKSEPIENDKTLSEVLGYLYRDNKDSFKKDGIINRDEIKNIKLGKNCIAMDDYSSMTNSELKDIINFLCKDKLEELSDAQKFEAVTKADVNSRLRTGMIKTALGISAAAAKKETPKKKTETKKKCVKKTETETKVEKVKKKNEPEAAVPVSAEEKPKKAVKKELPIWLL